MNARENIRNLWFDMSIVQRISAGIVIVLAVGLFIGSLTTSLGQWLEVRRLELEANSAKETAKTALEATLKIAKEKKLTELKLAESEARRNAKQPELDQAVRVAATARDEYERAVRQRRKDNPSPEQLCVELADLGISCY